MSYPFGSEANEHYRYAFKQGLSGWDVAAFQIVLTDVFAQHHDLTVYAVTVDGQFGPKTNAAVVDWQKKHSALTVDGIAGILTQQSLCVGISGPTTTKYGLPAGLLKGVIEGESGYAVAAVTPAYPDGSRDYGAYQDNLQASEQTDDRIAGAFSVLALAENTGAKIRRQKDIYSTKIASLSASQKGYLLNFWSTTSLNEAAWKCAILYHNWPAGAEKLASGQSLSTEPADWVINIGVNGISTPAQWAVFYVKTKVTYITSYPA